MSKRVMFKELMESGMKSAKGSYHGPTCAEDSWKQTHLEEKSTITERGGSISKCLNSPEWFFMNTGCREQGRCVGYTKAT